MPYKGPCKFDEGRKLELWLKIIVGASGAEYLESVARREMDWIRILGNLLRGVLDKNGFTLNEISSNAVRTLKRLRKLGLNSMKGGERRLFKGDTRWVADIDEHAI